MEAVIFDMDGVLIDSEPFYVNNLYNFLKSHYKNVSFKEVSKIAGASSEYMWKLMAYWWGKEISPLEIEEKFFKWTTENIQFYDIINPYVRTVIKKVKNYGLKTAIASSSPMKEIEEVVKVCELQDYLDLMVSGDMFKESKPNPEIYFYTCKRLGIDARNCLIIEDSTYGIEAAKKTGATVIGMKDYRFGFDQKQCDYLISDLLELLNFIEERM